MKIGYFCRSLSRPEKIVVQTMKVFEDHLKGVGEKLHIFTEPNEYHTYKATLRRHEAIVHKIPTILQGFWSVDNELRKVAIELGYTHIFWLDDDVTGFEDKEGLKNSECLDKHLPVLKEYLERDPMLGMIGFERFRYWVFNKKLAKRFTHRNKQVFGVSIWRTDAMSEVPEGITNFDDVYLGLKAFELGFHSLYYNGFGKKVYDNTNKGGNRIHQNAEKLNKSISLIKNEFSEIKAMTRTGDRIDIDDSYYKKQIEVLKKDCSLNEGWKV